MQFIGSWYPKADGITLVAGIKTLAVSGDAAQIACVSGASVYAAMD